MADIVAGNPATATVTVTSNFNSNGSVSLSGLNGTKFLMVLNLDGYIPADATPETYYLGWWNEEADNGILVVPEPGTLVLTGLGLVGIAVFRRLRAG